MDKPKISIIVPIYNMERYLRQSLDSIKAQTFTDWECILVDDGSKDTSPIICDEYAAADSRFKVIHKPNGGVSSARNAGLDAATAEYIGFVDPDDWAEPGLFQYLYNLITEYDADIAQVGFFKEYKGRQSTKHLVPRRMIIDGNEAIREISFDKLPNYLWNKLHRRSIVTCKFPEGRTFEDIFVYGHWLQNVKKMVLDPAALYHYRMRRGSIVHSDAATNRFDSFHACIDTMEMIKSLLSGEKDIKRKNAYINKAAISAAKKIARSVNDTSLRDETINKIRNEVMAYPLPSPRYMGLKTWWRGKLLRGCPRFFSSLMRGVYVLDFDIKNRERKCFE